MMIRMDRRKHCELFPTTLTVTRDTIMNLKDILLQAAAGEEGV